MLERLFILCVIDLPAIQAVSQTSSSNVLHLRESATGDTHSHCRCTLKRQSFRTAIFEYPCYNINIFMLLHTYVHFQCRFRRGQKLLKIQRNHSTSYVIFHLFALNGRRHRFNNRYID